MRPQGAGVGAFGFEGADARTPVHGGQFVFPGRVVRDGQEPYEPVVHGVPVPDGLDRRHPRRDAGGAGGEGLQVERGVGRTGHPLAEVLVAGVDDLLGLDEVDPPGAAGFQDDPNCREAAVLQDVRVDLSADAGR
ncbi:hypothetical protein ACODT5_34580 [Streptomyces sp. 5.8]|uniref:hypothetical protein n=1 Tax=Streptomyces sp. 5.8 TaxID=3406571 RepID=UPI003BB68327